ncbi:hypothetical protein DL764_008780 [Monosporascus ibericus]|uniref:Pali-domain-containing protein n=1 Tax=Monosporascus ibericus TaxID=155417 RepID=A0A4Q4SWN0_9PEZI|nr:hypothetical protein DL764_008780 [Monosporascus ibericus]
MRQTGFIHHIGSFLLLVATVLLIVTSISAPAVKNISMLRVDIDRGTANGNNPVVTFGTFGWCTQDLIQSSDDCSGAHVGYDPSRVLAENAGLGAVDNSEFRFAAVRRLTNVMVLHPVAAGLAFISFLLALGAGVVGSLLSALAALLTFVVIIVVLACDFAAFAIVRHAINDDDDGVPGARASWGTAAWTLVAAAVVAFFGMLVVFFTCCSARLHRRRENRARAAPKTDYGAPERRRRWF